MPVTGPADRSDQSDRGWFGWRIIRVRGRNMVPTLDDADHVLSKRYGWFARPRPGDEVWIRRGDKPMLIKRLRERDENGRIGLSRDGAPPPRY